jgi:hypothetical protein
MKPIAIRPSVFTSILVSIVVVFSAYQSVPKLQPEIVLQDERLSITPREFYIAKVEDERENRTAIAWLLQYGNVSKLKPEPVAVDLRGGGIIAIKQFIERNLPRNTMLRPVGIKLKKCIVNENALAGGLAEGHVNVVISFNLLRDDGTPDSALHLVDYNGSATYKRTPGQPQDIEPILRRVLVNGLVYIDTWMNKEARTNLKLARAVKLVLNDYLGKPEGDTIYYSSRRPLNWRDFQSKTGSMRYDAQVFPTFGYDEHVALVAGVVNIHLIMKVSLPKSACWVKDASRNDYTLNHEQRHFDIAKIAAEHFKQKIRSENLTVGGFEGVINVIYLESYREMNNLQRLYDNDTSHGTDQTAQYRWNEKIDK